MVRALIALPQPSLYNPALLPSTFSLFFVPLLCFSSLFFAIIFDPAVFFQASLGFLHCVLALTGPKYVNHDVCQLASSLAPILEHILEKEFISFFQFAQEILLFGSLLANHENSVQLGALHHHMSVTVLRSYGVAPNPRFVLLLSQAPMWSLRNSTTGKQERLCD